MLLRFDTISPRRHATPTPARCYARARRYAATREACRMATVATRDIIDMMPLLDML